MLTVGSSAACSNPFAGGDCVALGVAGVSANVVDAATKQAPSTPPTLRLTDGTYLETVTGVLGRPDAVQLSGAIERPGRYQALFEATGYQPVIRDDLVVRRSGKCNYLQPVRLNIELARSITAELVRVADENTLWSGSFDRLATELPAVQDSIIRAINAMLMVRDGPGARASGTMGARGTTDVEAYDRFLRGEFLRRRFEIPSAVALLQQAVSKDPSFVERGIRAHEPLWNSIWIACEPMFGSLRTQPRFVAWVKELGATRCAPDRRWPIKRQG